MSSNCLEPMTDRSPKHSIARTFRDLSEDEVADIETASTLARLGWSAGFGWDEVLKSRRILIISEAGAGKTFECRAQRDTLWAKGLPAFFVELAALSNGRLEDTFDAEEAERFDSWLRAQSETATFFLDSIDELELTLGSFEQALKRLNKALAGQLGQAQIIITSRPISIDQQLIRKHLPIPEGEVGSAHAFADIIMSGRRQQGPNENGAKPWRNIGLMPLSTEQIQEMAALEGVFDPGALLADIRKRDAEEFAQRPQDLIELCADWREHHRIRTHSEQVATNATTRLRPRKDRAEKAALSADRAMDGASRLALATMLTRKLTLRYSAESDRLQSSGMGVALDAAKILTDWTADELTTLLERPLFGFATYGRVRFHHRSAIEFLAAKRLDTLLGHRVPAKAVKRLLFAETAQGQKVVRPSMRPIAAWLSLWRESIYEEVLGREPAVLLNHGDPQSLRPGQRIETLEAYARRYGKGGWRGLSVPEVQVHRFGSPELAPAVNAIWSRGVESPDVRDLLLELIAAAKLTDCSDIVYGLAVDERIDIRERVAALDALIALDDARLPDISLSISNGSALWPEDLARSALLRLFPGHLSVSELCRILERVKEPETSIGDISWQLPRVIRDADLTPTLLRELQDRLTRLVTGGVEWDEAEWPHVQSRRPDLVSSLIAACVVGLQQGSEAPELLRSSMIALRLTRESDVNGELAKELGQLIADASSTAHEIAFWAGDMFLQGLRPQTDARRRLFDLTYRGAFPLSPDKDRSWILAKLAERSANMAEREMMLYASLHELPPTGEDPQEYLRGLGKFVSDAPQLLDIIESRLKPRKRDPDRRSIEEERAKRRQASERDEAKARASWVQFWNEIAENPDAVFGPERANATVWNLWRAMAQSGQQSRASGWNRRFIEAQFGKEVAHRLRTALFDVWRRDEPTLWSERPEAEKNSFLVRWQLGLAAITAEAEDPLWAKRLSEEEARRASRYVPIELNGFPSWLDSLVNAHASPVDSVLGRELALQLRHSSNSSDYQIFLQNIRNSSPRVRALFVPRLRTWLYENLRSAGNRNGEGARWRLSQVVEILQHSEDPEVKADLEARATHSLSKGLDGPFADVWLPVLMQLSPELGVDLLEQGLRNKSLEPRGAAVKWFAALFGRDRAGPRVDVRDTRFTPRLLLRLVRLAYRHVRIEDDVHHEGSYTPDLRDDAESGRSALLSALLAATGSDAWDAKLEMAADPLFAHFRDRAIAIACERAAEEADSAVLAESDVVAWDRYGESPPTTRDAMFAVMRDRLDDIDDLLLEDISPREAWAGIVDERVMRRELARALRDDANHIYTVDQEAATADEKETDIRLRSTSSSQQATIELKIGDKDRSGADLRATLRDQLLTKYLAAEDCRSGCLLVTVASDREWNHPDTREKLDFSGLIEMLEKEAERLSLEMGGTVRIMAKGLDLRPRLPKERNAKSVDAH
jgi:hypothetical protein